jgi:hypothetical protein
MIQILFEGASTCILVNEQTTRDLLIKRGISHKCPLAIYIFLIVGQALNSIALEELKQGKVHKVKLLRSNKQQVIDQYADDTSFIIRVAHKDVARLMHFLQLLSKVSSLFINGSKSVTYWVGGKRNERPSWTTNFNWT